MQFAIRVVAIANASDAALDKGQKTLKAAVAWYN